MTWHNSNKLPRILEILPSRALGHGHQSWTATFSQTNRIFLKLIFFKSSNVKMIQNPVWKKNRKIFIWKIQIHSSQIYSILGNSYPKPDSHPSRWLKYGLPSKMNHQIKISIQQPCFTSIKNFLLILLFWNLFIAMHSENQS